MRAGCRAQLEEIVANTVKITRDNFEEHVKEGTVVLDWWATWCGPCLAFAPVFERVAAKHPDVVFGKVNTEEQRELATQFQIHAIPTLMVIRDGVLIFNRPGMVAQGALEDIVAQVEALDMDEVHRKIAEAEAAQPRAAAAK
jgi:thioredoxin 1